MLLHARFSVVDPIPFLLAAFFFLGHPYIGSTIVLPDKCTKVSLFFFQFFFSPDCACRATRNFTAKFVCVRVYCDCVVLLSQQTSVLCNLEVGMYNENKQSTRTVSLSAIVKALIPYFVGLLGIYCFGPNRPLNPTIVSSTEMLRVGFKHS